MTHKRIPAVGSKVSVVGEDFDGTVFAVKVSKADRFLFGVDLTDGTRAWFPLSAVEVANA